MKITDKILSIPPYISTSWKNIISLQVEPRSSGLTLLIELVTGSKIEIPNLDQPVMEKIFSLHVAALEEEGQAKSSVMTSMLPFPFPNLEGMVPLFGTMMGHNPDQKESPPIPAPIIEKIALMAKDFLSGETLGLKQPEENCNCPHCQVTRAILNQGATLEIDEQVSDEDLKFRIWDIQPESNKVYSVTNPLDKNEQYHIFLGNPLGCSCGQENCEHIEHLKAFLKS